MQTLSDKQIHELARKRVDFRAHLVVYVVIIGVLWAVWLATGRGYPWPIWPMGGWAIGLIFHYLFEYRPSRLFSEEEEFEKLKRELEDKERRVQ